MNGNIELKDLWQRKEAAIPRLDEVYQLAKESKKQLLIRTILVNVIFVFTAAVLIAIWIYFQPQLFSTKIGISLTILAISAFVLAQNSIFFILHQSKGQPSIKEFLEGLRDMRRRELFMQTTLMNAYFILLSSGILLYMYEYVSKSILILSLAYGLTLVWFLFTWIYLRPKAIKKQQEKTNQLIQRVELIEKQLDAKERNEFP